MKKFSVAIIKRNNNKEIDLDSIVKCGKGNSIQDCLSLLDIYDDEVRHGINAVVNKDTLDMLKEEYDKNYRYVDTYEGYTDKYFMEFLKTKNIFYNEKLETYTICVNPYDKRYKYDLGGAWSGLLVDKKGNRHDYLKVKDIDFEATKEAKRKELVTEWKKIGHDENNRVVNEYFEVQSLKDFIDEQSTFHTYAVYDLDKDLYMEDDYDEPKNWIKDYYNNFIKDLDDDDYIIILDATIL